MLAKRIPDTNNPLMARPRSLGRTNIKQVTNSLCNDVLATGLGSMLAGQVYGIFPIRFVDPGSTHTRPSCSAVGKEKKFFASFSLPLPKLYGVRQIQAVVALFIREV